MSKQLHLRIDDELFKELKNYSTKTEQSIQECTTIALRQLLERDSQNHKKQGTNYSFADLFAGIGGMRLALEDVGAHCLYSCEWDKFCQKTYFSNFGEQPDGDISRITENKIPNFDILAAGFPITPFNNDRNSIEEKIADTPFFELFRILKEKRPKAFIFECIKTLKTHNKGKTIELIKEALKSLNYSYNETIISADNYVPQKKERLIMVGFDQNQYGDNISFDFNVKDSKTDQKLKDILEEEVDLKFDLSNRLLNYYNQLKSQGKAQIADLNGYANALNLRYSKDGFDILIDQEDRNPRRLTPRECARLQGFPDSFKIPVSNTQAYKQFANAVVIPMMSDVAKLVMNKLDELEEEKNKIYEVEYII